jgi:vacuolar-type H+-ATPase catalytic subunit A/Vma1
MWFIIGSRAIKEIKEDFYRDTNDSDLDLYCSQEDFIKFMNENHSVEQCFPLKKNKYRIKITNQPIIELKIYDKNSTYEWLSQSDQKDLLSEHFYMLDNIKIHIPNLNCLKNIKKSHLYWPISWLKSIEDYNWLKNNTNKDTLKELIFAKKIKSEMKKLHGYISHGKLNDLNSINVEELKNEVLLKENEEKKVIFIIHEKLSLKQKLKVINNWDNYKNLFFEKYSLKNRRP